MLNLQLLHLFIEPFSVYIITVKYTQNLDSLLLDNYSLFNIAAIILRPDKYNIPLWAVGCWWSWYINFYSRPQLLVQTAAWRIFMPTAGVKPGAAEFAVRHFTICLLAIES